MSESGEREGARSENPVIRRVVNLQTTGLADRTAHSGAYSRAYNTAQWHAAVRLAPRCQAPGPVGPKPAFPYNS
ncbi:hypothetical protein [Paraburkholderia adhaesiva]|uniref:hypothetical protein n=1 Tax=Paraburkholderia adhaesiva TaxID=2883244 RepID=UPI001F28E674|nr:hypothetical protein [Paraburkholderia adhaesiva]